jgi:hypothetical protein
VAAIFTGLGEQDSAVAWLERACGQRAFTLVFLKVRPEFASLRGDPRFADLVRRMRLP